MQINFLIVFVTSSLSNSEIHPILSLMQSICYVFHLGVTVEGLEAEVLMLDQKIASLETRLLSLPPTDDSALELTINLSALEDQLQVSVYNLDSNHRNNVVILM